MIVGFVQFSPRFGDKKENFSRIRALTKNVNADLLVLPELFATGYACISRPEALFMAEASDGMTADFFRQLSAETGAVIVGGMIERDINRVFNSSLMVYGDQIIGTYRKIHLFNREKLWFDQGDLPLQVYTVKGMRIGMMICFDWIFPEVMRTLALKGAQIVAHPSNLVLPHCQNAMITRCLENRVFAVTANRIGRETRGDDDFLFTGKSQVTCVTGNVLATSGTSEICARTLEIDINHADKKSINQHNDLFKDRRPDFYT